MTNDEYLKLKEIKYKFLRIRQMVDWLHIDVKATPIKRGVLGTYKCNQDIIKRDEEILENLEDIQKYLRELRGYIDDFVIHVKIKEET